MRVLVVGAGAVGQVLAHHLRKGGAQVSFLVKPRHAARRSFILHELPSKKTTRLDGIPVVTGPEPADLIILAVPANALVEPWLSELRAIAPLVVVQETDARDTACLVGFIAWSEGDTTTVWQPPLQATQLAGPHAAELAKLLKLGGLAARAVPSLQKAGVTQAILDTHMAALECARWSLAGFRHDRELVTLATTAAKEAARSAAARAGTRPPRLALLRPALVRAAVRIAPRAVPFDLERFLRAHYVKVGPQTRLVLGRLAGADTPALNALLERLRA